MGRVYRAEQLSTGRTVALKLLHSQFSGVADVVERFEREAEVTTHLSHPNIVKTIDYGQWDGRFYIAFEFFAGRSLADLLDAGPRRLTVERTVAIMRPVLEALEYAHGLGVVHRDLKPDNVMVVPAGGRSSRECVKLLDFGVAKLGDVGPTEGRKLTQVGMILGTPGYMSPEQAVGQEADARSDIYSCGVMLYEMLAGLRPFEGATGIEVLAMHVNTIPRSLREITGDASISSELEDAVMCALAKRPGDRFQSARDLRRGLERIAGPRDEHAISGIEKTIVATALPRRSRAGWLHAAVIAVAMATLIGLHLGREAPPQAGGVARASSLTDGSGPAAEGDGPGGHEGKQAAFARAKRSTKSRLRAAKRVASQ